MTLVAHHNVQIFFRGKMNFWLGSLEKERKNYEQK